VTAAIAVAVVLVIAVAGVSLAMQTQHPATARAPRPSNPVRNPPRRPGRAARPAARQQPPAPDPAPAAPPSRGPELLRSGKAADAKVISVVDERVTGSVVRSRLTLRVEPAGEDAFEVQIRHAFPTQDDRAAVRVGGTVAVRYDSEDHRRVVIAPKAH
jgi:hypothetical protein